MSALQPGHTPGPAKQERAFALNEDLAKYLLEGPGICLSITPVKSSVFKVFTEVVQDHAAEQKCYASIWSLNGISIDS